MKLASRDTERFLTSPPKELRIVLFYGQDEGVIKAGKDKLLKNLKIDPSDPFAFQELEVGQVMESPSLLYEALSAMSLTGDAPAVLIRQASDKLTPHLKEIIKDNAASNLLVLMAGDLDKRSTLRAFAEDMKLKQVVAVACYRDEGAGLTTLLRQFLQSRQIHYPPPVLPLLAGLLGNDRNITLAELEKLDLYLGEERYLTEEIVLSLLADNRHMMLSDAALSWFTGDMAAHYRLCERVFRSGENPVAMIRVMLNTADRLLAIHQKAATGLSFDQAMDTMRPPVFFKEKPLYEKALRRFSSPALLSLIAQWQLLEITIKRSGGDPLFYFHGVYMAQKEKVPSGTL